MSNWIKLNPETCDKRTMNLYRISEKNEDDRSFFPIGIIVRAKNEIKARHLYTSKRKRIDTEICIDKMNIELIGIAAHSTEGIILNA